MTQRISETTNDKFSNCQLYPNIDPSLIEKINQFSLSIGIHSSHGSSLQNPIFDLLPCKPAPKSVTPASEETIKAVMKTLDDMIKEREQNQVNLNK